MAVIDHPRICSQQRNLKTTCSKQIFMCCKNSEIFQIFRKKKGSAVATKLHHSFQSPTAAIQIILKHFFGRIFGIYRRNSWSDSGGISRFFFKGIAWGMSRLMSGETSGWIPSCVQVAIHGKCNLWRNCCCIRNLRMEPMPGKWPQLRGFPVDFQIWWTISGSLSLTVIFSENNINYPSNASKRSKIG